MFTKRELEILQEALNRLMNVHENEYEDEEVTANVMLKRYREEIRLYAKLDNMMENAHD